MDCAAVLGEIKWGIQEERLRVAMAANSAMAMLYWDIGGVILERQEREDWGARVIDRLSEDLRGAFPDMRGPSPHNLKYMRAFVGPCRKGQLCKRFLHKYPGITIWIIGVLTRMAKLLAFSITANSWQFF
jgi:hypothetical protein